MKLKSVWNTNDAKKRLLFPIKLKVWLLEKHCPQTLEHTDAFSCEGTKEPRPSRTKRQAALPDPKGAEELLSLGCQCRESRAGSRCGLPDGLGLSWMPRNLPPPSESILTQPRNTRRLCVPRWGQETLQKQSGTDLLWPRKERTACTCHGWETTELQR